MRNDTPAQIIHPPNPDKVSSRGVKSTSRPRTLSFSSVQGATAYNGDFAAGLHPAATLAAGTGCAWWKGSLVIRESRNVAMLAKIKSWFSSTNREAQVHKHLEEL